MASHPSNAKYPDATAVTFDEQNFKVTVIYNDHSIYVWDVRDIKKVCSMLRVDILSKKKENNIFFKKIYIKNFYIKFGSKFFKDISDLIAFFELKSSPNCKSRKPRKKWNELYATSELYQDVHHKVFGFTNPCLDSTIIFNKI